MFDMIGVGEKQNHYAQETAERVTRAVELNPKDARAWVLGAGAWLQMGHKEKTLEWIERAQVLSPTSSGVMYNSACMYAKMGETEGHSI